MPRKAAPEGLASRTGSPSRDTDRQLTTSGAVWQTTLSCTSGGAPSIDSSLRTVRDVSSRVTGMRLVTFSWSRGASARGPAVAMPSNASRTDRARSTGLLNVEVSVNWRVSPSAR